MKNVLLSVVVVAVLLAGGLGGTFATWSDSETSEGNSIKTGSVDLLVNGYDDLPWGLGVPPKVAIDCMIPCKIYGGFEVELWNAGQCIYPSHAYIQFKNADCFAIPAKEGSGYIDDPPNEVGSLVISPEPELVAQYGGKVDCVTVPGIGRTGDECSMLSHVYVWIMLDDTVPALDANGDPIIYDPEVCAYQGKMVGTGVTPEEDGAEIYLFDLMPCTPRTIYLWFHLQQFPEELFGYDFIPNDGSQHWKKFNDWPSWALMKDGVTFDMEFDLWLEDS